MTEGYEVVIKRFPESSFAALARAQIRKLQERGPAAEQSDSVSPVVAAAASQEEVVPAETPQVAAAPGPEAVELALGLERTERRRIQSGLASLGFDPGPADGLFGKRTRGAIGRMQTARGVDSTGFLDSELAKELLAAGVDAEARRVAEEQEERERSERTSRERAERLRAEMEERERLERKWPLGKVFRDCPECPWLEVKQTGDGGRIGVSQPVTTSEWHACEIVGGCSGGLGISGVVMSFNYKIFVRSLDSPEVRGNVEKERGIRDLIEEAGSRPISIEDDGAQAYVNWLLLVTGNTYDYQRHGGIHQQVYRVLD